MEPDLDEAMERLARAVLRRSPDVAHDLKTPLNIVVLNVELLRMRLNALSAEIASDRKVAEHCRALERESRRIAVLADAFLSVAQVPEGEQPERVELIEIFLERLGSEGFDVLPTETSCEIMAYRSRVEKTAGMVAEGIASVIQVDRSELGISVSEKGVTIRLEGPHREPRPEIGVLFKFYYVDSSDEPKPTLAAARLLIETLGGSIELDADEETGRFYIELQGDQ